MTLLTFYTKSGLQLVGTVLIFANIAELITRALITYLYTCTLRIVQSVRNTRFMDLSHCTCKCFVLYLEKAANRQVTGRD